MINLYFEILRWSVDPTIISKQKDTGKLNYSLLYLLYLFLNTFLTDTIFLSVLIYLIINSFYNKENDNTVLITNTLITTFFIFLITPVFILPFSEVVNKSISKEIKTLNLV